MDEEYIFTRSEFAKMLGIKPNTVRMRMRRGHYLDVSKFLKNKWMFKRVRLNPIKCASSSLPVSKHRKHAITKHGTTNYDNIRNPVTARKFKEHNEEMADKEDARILEEKQKKAFEDPFMLSEKVAFKKRRDELLVALDEAECGDYDRRKARKEGDEYY